MQMLKNHNHYQITNNQIMKRLLLLTCTMWLACVVMAANLVCTGTVVDEQGEPMIGASVTVVGKSGIGTTTDVDGRFKLSVPQGTKQLQVSYVGYKPCTVAASADMGTIKMEPSTSMLADVVVTQSVGRTRETPVAMSTIPAEEIEFKLGNQELLEILKTTPGVYTRSEGGGWGDAKTRVRGFQSENVAMLINGIPVNDQEWGGVYMSNWAGLSEVASSIQTQRGLGATMLSTPSIGGTINITTRTIDVEKGGSVWYGMGNDALNQFGVKLSTGVMKNGWAVTVLGSRKWADGYIQGTNYNAYNWFVNVTKRINEKHQIGFTGFGAPQWHWNRNYNNGLTIEGWQGVRNYMNGESPYRFNPSPYGLCEREIVGRPALRPPRACMGVGMFSGHLCRGRRPRRPAEGSRPLPTKRTVKGVQAQTCGPGMPGPYGVVDGWRVLAGRCA